MAITDLDPLNSTDPTASSANLYYKWNTFYMKLLDDERQIVYVPASANQRTLVLEMTTHTGMTVMSTIASMAQIENSLLDDPDDAIPAPIWKTETLSAARFTLTTPVTAFKILNETGADSHIFCLFP